MPRRLAMLKVVGSYETPQTRVTGNERKALVAGLGVGDVVEMLVVPTGGGRLAIRLPEGVTLLSPSGWLAYSVRKVAGEVPLATTVEIVIDG